MLLELRSLARGLVHHGRRTIHAVKDVSLAITLQRRLFSGKLHYSTGSPSAPKSTGLPVLHDCVKAFAMRAAWNASFTDVGTAIPLSNVAHHGLLA